jgi:hypothetical protein
LDLRLQGKDHKHQKCINSTKRGILKNHDLPQPLSLPSERKENVLDFFLNKAKGSKKIKA